MPRIRSSESGQLLLLSLLIMLSLGLSLFVVLFLNQYLTRSSVYALKKQRGVAIGDSALTVATTMLGSSPALWQAALSGSFPVGYDGSQQFTASFGTYRIQCSVGNTNLLHGDLKAANYQVRVNALAYVPSASGTGYVPARLVQAIVGPLTVGARLGDSTAVGAALLLAQFPHIGTYESPNKGNVMVHWGPIVSFSSMTFQFANGSPTACQGTACDPDTTYGHYPRLFSAGAIVPLKASPSPPPTTDNAFYWSYLGTAMSPLPLAVDINTYKDRASESYIGPTALINDGCAVFSQIGGYVKCTGGGTVHFPDDYRLVHTTSVIYIEGNAQVDGRFSVDVSSLGALVVTGNLTVADGPTTSPPTNPLDDILLRVPPTAASEYAAGISFPCSNTMTEQDGSGSCGSTMAGQQYVDFRGFLYVQGNLIVNGSGDNDSGKRVIVGTVRVGDDPNGTVSQLTVANNEELHIYYDDRVNRNVQVIGLVLTPDVSKYPLFLAIFWAKST